jgi:tetratricopeptide (TPR) repeat protein
MRTAFYGALIAVAFSSSLPAAQNRPDSSNRIAELQEWMAIVSQHAPGRVDAAVSTMRSWGRESLQNVRDDLAAIRLLMCGRCPAPQQADRFRTELVKVGAQRAWRTVHASKHIIELGEFAKRTVTQLDVNDLLKRGALLHTDVALRAPPILTWAASADYLPLQRTIVQVADGQQAALEATVDHLDMARRLLELVTPDPRADLRETPERDQTVRLWYRATMAALLDLRQLDVTHTAAALQLLPGEATVLFLAGAHHETLAAPRYQSAVATRTLGDVTVLGSEQEELRRAEELFSRAVKSDPEYVEAHLRLGQVLGRLGRHDEALVELRTASQAADPVITYYAHLLIGREEDARGNIANARAAYERAAAIVPRAQAPRLALSEIEMRSGNRAAARRWMDEALATTGSAPSPDPWTFYSQSAGRTAAALLAALGRAFPPAAGQK